MYPLEAELMNELQDTSGDDSLSAGAGAGKGSLRLGVLQNDPIKLWDVHFI